jgi:hypothetical protein
LNFTIFPWIFLYFFRTARKPYIFSPQPEWPHWHFPPFEGCEDEQLSEQNSFPGFASHLHEGCAHLLALAVGIFAPFLFEQVKDAEFY